MDTKAMGSEQSASMAVVEAVAAREGIDPLALEVPLYDAVNPDELDTLVRNASERGNPSSLQITFRYYGYDVRVTADGAVSLTASC